MPRNSVANLANEPGWTDMSDNAHFPRSTQPFSFRARRVFARRSASQRTSDEAHVRALVKVHAGPGFELREVPTPVIRDDEVLINVRRAGVCGTDVHIYVWDAWAQ